MHSMTVRYFLGVVLSVVSLSCASHAAPAKPASKGATIRTLGMFSDVEFSRETGDVGGKDLFFFHADKDYVLIVEGEGQLLPPSLCTVTTEGATVRFRKSAEGKRLDFTGVFSATHLSGKFSDGSSLKIPRKKCRLLDVFSNLSFSKESGDAMGMEIISFLADQSYVLFLQGAGDFREPVIVPAKSDAKTLQFGFKGFDGSVTTFKGTMSKTLLSGVLRNSSFGDPSVKLPAKKSFWE
jgi:hypothetical protein